MIKKKLLNAQFLKFKLIYEDGLINFYNKEIKIIKSLYTAKIKNITKKSIDKKHILILSYSMNYRIIL